jgi:fibronectin type 3 domain-containing protein
MGFSSIMISLSDVVSFSVTQPSSLDVNFDTEAKYTNGITALATDHVSVVSSRGYVVKAVAGTGSTSIAPGTVKITSTVVATNNGNARGITCGSAATVISAADTS